ncbi:INOSITOL POLYPHOSPHATE KINASE 1 [Salix purpurea]|uniref:Inositol-pentakisphosphate 2-kinase n=1 Tax=Salix purpurea TaxID=77065 RepID=A0A9Q0PB78_SALPP|nr:INOSITOL POLYPHOSPHATE KINASE 1 [Salix purpurea]
MEVKLEQKDAADWSYRGEGAANIVLAYTGSSPSFIGKVMRITKKARNGSSPKRDSNPSVLTEQERLLWRDVEELVASPTKEIAEQIYTQLVMSPLLGSKHVDAGMRVPVKRDFLECVEKNVIKQRPAWRVDVSVVDLERDSVIIMSDHSLFPGGVLKDGPCISVEIKPKCGFLPSSKFIAERNFVKMSATRFQMHQVLKLREQEISELSEYDPLDLFSGSKERIHKAIKDLYTTPQNNFRVFLNGSLILGGLGGGIKRTDAVAGKAFEDVLEGIILAENGLRTTSFIQLVAEAVYCSRVLDGLLEVQKLDNFDIEGAIHAYYNVVCQPCAVCQQLDEARPPHRCSSLHSIHIVESLKIVRDYLIAATAKDCSLMISFRPMKDGAIGSPNNHVYLQSTNQSFNYKVNFIDLDLKPLKKMVDYYELDKKILNCFIQMQEMEHNDGNAKTIDAIETINTKTIKDCKF